MVIIKNKNHFFIFLFGDFSLKIKNIALIKKNKEKIANKNHKNQSIDLKIANDSGDLIKKLKKSNIIISKKVSVFPIF